MRTFNHTAWIFFLLLSVLAQFGCSDDTSAGSEENTETSLETGDETVPPGEEVGTEIGEETALCTPECENKNCGSDGCGGVCGGDLQSSATGGWWL